MTETVTVKGDNLTADLLLWRRYGIKGAPLLADMMTLNPGLSDLGPILPLGTIVVLPDLPYPDTSVDVVTLFG